MISFENPICGIFGSSAFASGLREFIVGIDTLLKEEQDAQLPKTSLMGAQENLNKQTSLDN